MSRSALVRRTRRLVLVPMGLELARDVADGGRRSDWAAGFPQVGDVTIARLLVAGARHDPGHVDEQVWGPWEVRLLGAGDGVLIGTAGFHGPPEDGVVEVGYGIVPEARGRGLAGEAVSALLDVAREAGVHRVVAHVDQGNVASLRLLDRLRFTIVGRAISPSPEHGEDVELALDL